MSKIVLKNINNSIYYSLKQLPALTGIPLSSWRHWTRIMELDYFKMGERGTKYILGSDVIDFLKNHTKKKLK